MGHAAHRPYRNKAAFFEAALGPLVPLQGVQIHAFQLFFIETVVQKGGNGIIAVGVAPVVPVADDDP